MVRLSAPLLEMGGTAVIFGKAKREAAKEAEAEEVAGAVGLRPVTVHETTPVGIGTRHLHVFEKVAATPARRTLKVGRASGRKERTRTRAVGAVKAEWTLPNGSSGPWIVSGSSRPRELVPTTRRSSIVPDPWFRRWSEGLRC